MLSLFFLIAFIIIPPIPVIKLRRDVLRLPHLARGDTGDPSVDDPDAAPDAVGDAFLLGLDDVEDEDDNSISFA